MKAAHLQKRLSKTGSGSVQLIIRNLLPPFHHSSFKTDRDLDRWLKRLACNLQSPFQPFRCVVSPAFSKPFSVPQGQERSARPWLDCLFRLTGFLFGPPSVLLRCTLVPKVLTGILGIQADPPSFVSNCTKGKIHQRRVLQLLLSCHSFICLSSVFYISPCLQTLHLSIQSAISFNPRPMTSRARTPDMEAAKPLIEKVSPFPVPPFLLDDSIHRSLAEGLPVDSTTAQPLRKSSNACLHGECADLRYQKLHGLLQRSAQVARDCRKQSLTGATRLILQRTPWAHSKALYKSALMQ